MSLPCWSDENPGNLDAESENVDIDGNEIMLKPGEHIHEIKDERDADNGYGDTAYYSFYADYNP